MKRQVTEALGGYCVEMIDTHNTAPVCWTVRTDQDMFMIKAEYGDVDTNTIFSEISWYQRRETETLHPDLVHEYSCPQFSMLVLTYIQNAQTLDQLAERAVQDRAVTDVADLVVEALAMDTALFKGSTPVSASKNVIDRFYAQKYKSRMAEATKYRYLSDLLGAPTQLVNEHRLYSPTYYMDQIQEKSELYDYLTPDHVGLIHGDLHFGNILEAGRRLYLVDPNGEPYMPIEYDYGKMLHSVHGGYSQIMKNRFGLEKIDEGYRFELEMPKSYGQILSRMQQYLTEQEYIRGLYAEALHFVTMLPHHAANERETTALYLRSIQLFQELFDRIAKTGAVR